VKLHYDNLVVRVAEDPALGPMPSYATLRRYLRARGLFKLPRRRARATPGTEAAERHLASYEVRSYETEHVLALLHADYHAGSRAGSSRARAPGSPRTCSACSMTARACAAICSGT
jgi:hypothetical protein